MNEYGIRAGGKLMNVNDMKMMRGCKPPDDRMLLEVR
jgi:hypothetical protein